MVVKNKFRINYKTLVFLQLWQRSHVIKEKMLSSWQHEDTPRKNKREKRIWNFQMDSFTQLDIIFEKPSEEESSTRKPDPRVRRKLFHLKTHGILFKI